ncbi:acylneuraminate cytidylyltransferase family protein [bacterium]|nr:acylneuraminate cytidylyltransferase family protein [bacterium]
MYKGYTIFTTVCARGGSKGVKNKNIKVLAGKPMICYTLDIIKKSKLIDDYVVSTDSSDIMKVVEDYGFAIRFKRPKKLAGDKVSRLEVIKHSVLWMEKHFNKSYDIVIDLGVATPLKTVKDVEGALMLLTDSKCSNVTSVAPSDRNPYYNMVEEVNGKVKVVKKAAKKLTDRRDAPKVYSMNDGINVFKRDVLFSKNPIINSKSKIYVMPEERSIDIDTETDFKFAEFLLEKKIVKI